MINRCKHCDSICPDFSDSCDCCYMLDEESREVREKWKEYEERQQIKELEEDSNE